jgi:hypothetical protein
MFRLIKRFFGYNPGYQMYFNGIGGPQGDSLGTAQAIKPWPQILRNPDFIVAPLYGAAATNWSPKPGPGNFQGIDILNVVQKPETGTDSF